MASIANGHVVDVVKYNSVARMLHWIIAILIIGNIAGGLLHDPLEDIVSLMPTHKAIGITVLVLSIVRVIWRFSTSHPPLPASVTAFQRVASKIVQFVLYLLMFIMPLSGWVMTSAGTYPLTWFGLFSIPKFDVTKSDPIYGISHEAHELLGWVMLALVIGHVAAALYHHFVMKDAVLKQMA
ncbi:cytochrome b [Croceicoccus mobilis]|uniref:Cytochrome b n=1 Tax=Croceicoccus mobilis TaxID=1703339 RepID=A0A916YZH8_9SPHN|nr:cytochrome b [Croceicoccus mobilis]GGD68987.1 cytochrome b [Croceicoccus mobilis]